MTNAKRIFELLPLLLGFFSALCIILSSPVLPPFFIVVSVACLAIFVCFVLVFRKRLWRRRTFFLNSSVSFKWRLIVPVVLSFLFSGLYFLFYFHGFYSSWWPEAGKRDYRITAEVVSVTLSAEKSQTSDLNAAVVRLPRYTLRLLSVDGQSISAFPESLVRVGVFSQQVGQQDENSAFNQLKNTTSLQHGQVISALARLGQVTGFENQFGFNYRRWSITNNVKATGYLKTNHLLANSKISYGQRVSHRLSRYIETLKNRGFILALTLADRRWLTTEQQKDLQTLGLSHLFAISGLHIMLLFSFSLMAINGLCSALRVTLLLPYRWVLSTLFVWYYIVLIGSPVTAVRAGLLILLFVSLKLSYRRIEGFRLLLLVAAISLLFKPFWLLSAAWQMSFFAVFSILLFTRIWPYTTNDEVQEHYLKPDKSTSLKQDSGSSNTRLLRWRRRIWFLRKLRYKVLYFSALQLWLSVMLAPIVIYWFGIFSPWSLITNLLAIPLFSVFIVPLAFLGTLLALMDFTFAADVFVLLDRSLSLLWQILKWMTFNADSPVYISANVTPFVLYVVLLVLAIGKLWGNIRARFGTFISLLRNRLSLCFPLPKKRWLIGCCSALAISFLLILVTVQMSADNSRFSSNSQKSTLLTVLDVGQGTSVMFNQGERAMLFDLGPIYPSGFNATESVIKPNLVGKGIKVLDSVVVSHLDADHKGDIGTLASWQMNLVVNGCAGDVIDFSAAITNSIKSWQNLHVEYIWPRHLDVERFSQQGSQTGEKRELSRNDLSCMIKVTETETGVSVLFTGDISKEIETYLVHQHKLGDINLQADILIAAHHGSRLSNSFPFLFRVNPKIVVFTTGAQNRFGFPHEEVIKRVEKLKARYYTTSDHGEVSINLSSRAVERFVNGELNDVDINYQLSSTTPFWKRQNPFSFQAQIR